MEDDSSIVPLGLASNMKEKPTSSEGEESESSDDYNGGESDSEIFEEGGEDDINHVLREQYEADKRVAETGVTYIAVRVGYARAPYDRSHATPSNDQDVCDGGVPPRKKRKREAGLSTAQRAASPSSTSTTTTTTMTTTQPSVKIRSAIFLYWRDARQFVDDAVASSDSKAEYAAFDSFEKAEDYLVREERESSMNVAMSAEAAIRGGGADGDDVAPSQGNNAMARNSTSCRRQRFDRASFETFLGNMAAGPLGTSFGGMFGNVAMGGMGNIMNGMDNIMNGMGGMGGIGQTQTQPGIDDHANATWLGGSLSIPNISQAIEPTNEIEKNADEPNVDQSTKNAETTTPSKPKGKKICRNREGNWDKMYRKMVEYKQNNDGSTEIPEIPEEERDNPENKELVALRTWCILQQTRHRRYARGYTGGGNLTEERVDKLRELGLPLGPSYDEMYERLANHKAETGALDVIADVDYDLFVWTKEQKKMLAQHFQGKPITLSDDQITNLKSLGFEQCRPGKTNLSCVVDTGSVEKKWLSMLEALVKYKEDHGTFTLPNDTSALSKAERQVKYWIDAQRKEYKKLEQGKESSLTAQRLQRLTAIGYDLASHCQEMKTWDERMESLRTFLSEHGHLKPNRCHPLNPFVANIRHFYRQKQEGKANCLTDERVNDLVEIGFVFRAGKTPNCTALRKTWDERFEDLVAYKEEHGHTLVPQLSGPLGVWVKEQRTGYRRMKKGQKTPMNHEKALRLKEIGFHFDAARFKGPNREVE